MRAGRQQQALGKEHSAVRQDQKQGPAPSVPLEEMPACQAAGDQHEKKILEMEIAHGLERGSANESCRGEQDHRDGLLKCAIEEQSETEARELGFSSAHRVLA